MKRILYLISVLLISFAGYSQTDDQKALAYCYNRCNKVCKKNYKGAIADFNAVIKPWSGGKYEKSKAFFWRGLVKIDSGQKDSGCLDLSKAKKLGYAKAYEVIDIYCQ